MDDFITGACVATFVWAALGFMRANSNVTGIIHAQKALDSIRALADAAIAQKNALLDARAERIAFLETKLREAGIIFPEQ